MLHLINKSYLGLLLVFSLYTCLFLAKRCVKNIHQNKKVTQNIRLINELGLFSFILGIFVQLISLIEEWDIIRSTANSPQFQSEKDLNVISFHYISVVPNYLFYPVIYPIIGLAIFLITRFITQHLISLQNRREEEQKRKVSTTPYIVLVLCFGVMTVNAQNVNIPDPNFKTYLINDSTININGDSEIQINEAVNFTGTINCTNLFINNLIGIETFHNLTVLQCGNNQLTSLDLSRNTALKLLHCNNNQLTSLDLSRNKKLTKLYCYSNQIKNLDLSQNTELADIYRYNKKLKSIDLEQDTKLQAVPFCLFFFILCLYFFLTMKSVRDLHQNKTIAKKVKFINQLGLFSFILGIFRQLISLRDAWHIIKSATQASPLKTEKDISMINVHYMSFAPDRFFNTLIYPITGIAFFLIARFITQYLLGLQNKRKKRDYNQNNSY